MSKFQKLMHGALEKLAKRQAELDELQKNAAKQLELMAAAKPRYTTITGGSGLRLKHGTPFDFDRFDFESNMLKGEGAMAFGPGGYMTGDEGLARTYATNLFKRHANPPRQVQTHRALRTALTDQKNMPALAEYLRAVNVGRGLPHALERPTGHELRDLGSPPAHRRNDPPSYNYKSLHHSAPQPSWLYRSDVRADDYEPYVRAAEKALGSDALTMLGQSGRIGSGGRSPLEAIRMGSELRAQLASDAPGLRPRISERLSLLSPEEASGYMRPDGRGLDWQKKYAARAGLSLDPAQRMNLNSTWRAIEGRPGNTRVKLSMGDDGYVDLRKPGLNTEPWAPPEGLARRVYSADLNASLDDLMGYDIPLAEMSPKVVGALARVAERGGFLDELRPDMTGAQVISRLPKLGKPLDQVRALKEAGVPAMHFLRAGHRGVVPNEFDPRHYNFVVFDQDALGDPDKYKFSEGGRV